MRLEKENTVSDGDGQELLKYIKVGNSNSKPNMITDIVQYLGSVPLPRFAGWQPREDKVEDRKFTRQDSQAQYWVGKSYSEYKDKEASEQNVRKLVRSQKNADRYKPPMIAIQDIMKAEVKEAKGGGTPSFSILLGSNALHNPNFAVFQDAVMVMASQANCLESPSANRGVIPLGEYASDQTQGPALAMATVDASIARLGFKEDCDMVRAWLAKRDPSEENFNYENGYLLPRRGKVTACTTLLSLYGEEILMNIQQARVDNEEKDNQRITQIPCFAFAFGTNDVEDVTPRRPLADVMEMPKLCQTLLALQYQAAAKVAVLKSQQLNKRIALVLPPLGGGSFIFLKNPEGVRQAIRAAIRSIAPIVAEANVDVVFSVYDKYHELTYYKNIFEEEVDKQQPTLLSHSEMQKLSPGTVIGTTKLKSEDIVALTDKEPSIKLPKNVARDYFGGDNEDNEESSIETETELKPSSSTSSPGKGFFSFFKDNPKLVGTVALASIPTSIPLTYMVSSASDAFFNTASMDAVNKFFSAKMRDPDASLGDIFKTPGFIYGLAAFCAVVGVAIAIAMHKYGSTKQNDHSQEEENGISQNTSSKG